MQTEVGSVDSTRILTNTCKGVPPVGAPHRYRSGRKKGAPTEGRPYRYITMSMTKSLERFAYTYDERASGLAVAIVNSKIDWVSFCQPESDPCSASRQHVAKTDVRELRTDAAHSAKSDYPAAAKAPWPRDRETIFGLCREHPSVLIAPSGVPAQVVLEPKETQIIGRDSIACGRTAHRSNGNQLMIAQANVLVESGLVILITELAADRFGEEIDP